MKTNNRRLVVYMTKILAVVLVLGMFLGKILRKDEINNKLLIYPQNKLSALIDFIEEEYVDTVNKAELIESAIPMILESLDPHSLYIPAKELQSMNEPLEGNFEGIGIQFNIQKDTVMVVNTIPGGPSEMVGVMPGDRIVKVNDSLIAGVKITNSQIMKLLKGKRGTKVIVSVSRKSFDELINFDIIRDRIPLESVDVAYMVNDEIGYIKISKFALTTYDEFIEAITILKSKGLKKLIVDLRGNGGGFMNAATSVANEFLSGGELIVYTEGKRRPKNPTVANSSGSCLDIDITILIDELSASASEILAGAIQDNDRGIVVGRRSFGKGLVQEQVPLNDGSAIRLTIARYYTPTGRCIQKSYENGLDDYLDDIGNRYLHGELINQDSIQFPDSLKYYTPGGKVVYGGGGIMPDIFVPVDTSGYSLYLNKIINKGLIYRFAFEYTDQNRKKLNTFKEYKSLVSHLDNQRIFDKLITYAEQNGLERNAKDIKYSRFIIEAQLKGFIARNILDNNGFYPVIKDIDKTLLKAIALTKN